MDKQKRILIVDDNPSIHEDFKKTINIDDSGNAELDQIEDLLFDDNVKRTQVTFKFKIDDAYQGEEAVEMVNKAVEEGYPYALIFMDVRMPPGIDGIQAIERIWEKHPYTEVVICTAYSDYSWDEILHKFGETDRLLFLKKPFNVVAVKQMALSLTTKWEIARKNRDYLLILEEEVERRTSELRKLLEHMEELKERAEQSDKLKSTFLANMSHEIRNPLNTILGFTELLERKKNIPEDRKEKYIKSINVSGRSLLRLINDIIDIAKIEAGQLELNFSVCELNSLIDDLEAFFNMDLKNKSNTAVELIVEKDVKGRDYSIQTDVVRLRQVFNNLVHNALKFTDEGYVKIGYKIEEDVVEFYVEDTGVGIPEDKLNDVFDRFKQVESSRTEFGGTGLGLAISKNLVELLGGKISATSELDKGSRFSFFLPIEEPEKPEGTNYESSSPSYSWKGKYILVAEDEERNFILLQEILRDTNIDITWVRDGQEGIDVILEGDKQFDVVLSDIKMPNKDGYELLKFVKSKNERIPVIGLSAFAMEEERKKYLHLGFDAYLEKPVDIIRLLSTLNKYLVD